MLNWCWRGQEDNHCLTPRPQSKTVKCCGACDKHGQRQCEKRFPNQGTVQCTASLCRLIQTKTEHNSYGQAGYNEKLHGKCYNVSATVEAHGSLQSQLGHSYGSVTTMLALMVAPKIAKLPRYKAIRVGKTRRRAPRSFLSHQTNLDEWLEIGQIKAM